MDARSLIWALRGEGDTVECARCGKALEIEEAVPEEAGEWECYPCNKRCNEAEARRRTIDDLDAYESELPK